VKGKANADSVGVWTSFRRFFLRGLAALLPTLLTIAILVWAYNFVERNISRHITRAWIALAASKGPDEPIDLAKWQDDLLKYGTPIPGEYHPQLHRQMTLEYKIAANPHAPIRDRRRALWEVTFRKYHLGLMGFLLAMLAVYFVGFYLASLMGRTTWRAAESGLARVPLIKAIYPHIKQVTDLILNQQERTVRFRGVVAVQYPSKGIWSLGLQTGESLRAIRERSGTAMVSIFIPSSPTPVTGYVITVPAKDVIEVPITIDEAFRFVVTGGVILPRSEAWAHSEFAGGAPGAKTDGKESGSKLLGEAD
jgi:uncharacterized membrane protein